MGAILKEFAEDLHQIKLPSTLWAVHLDPEYEYIALLRVTFYFDKLINEKAVILTRKDSQIETCIYLNDEEVDLAKSETPISNVQQLEKLICDLETLKFCINSDKGTNCTKYILGSGDNFCESCAFQVAVEEPQKYLDNISTSEFNAVLLETLKSEATESCRKEKEKKCLCAVCGKVFASNSNVQYHMLTHSKEKPFVCKICMKSFAKKYNLEVHVRIHSGERPYVCSKCGKTYASRSNLSTHLNSFHRDVKQHRCEFCHMTFVHPRLLKIHIRKHTKEKPYQCSVCQKQFAKNIHLTVHTRTHTGEKPHQCTICSKAFTTSGNLSSHVKNNHKN